MSDLGIRSMALNSCDPYLACRNGITEHPGYMKCEICSRRATCTTGQMNFVQSFTQPMMEKWHNESLEGRTKYFIGDYGWTTGDWRKVTKNKFLKEFSPKFYCWNGLAAHPKFFQCEKCPEFSTCELGEYRMRQKAREKVQKIMRKEEYKKFWQDDLARVNNDIKDTGRRIKNFFESVADFVEKLFT